MRRMIEKNHTKSETFYVVENKLNFEKCCPVKLQVSRLHNLRMEHAEGTRKRQSG